MLEERTWMWRWKGSAGRQAGIVVVEASVGGKAWIQRQTDVLEGSGKWVLERESGRQRWQGVLEERSECGGGSGCW